MSTDDNDDKVLWKNDPPAAGKYLAEFERRRLLRRLKRLEHDPEATALAIVIEGCESAKPCYSAACPVCSASFQHIGVRAVDRLIAKPARGELRGRMALLSLIPGSGCVDPDRLGVETMFAARSEMLTALAAANMPPCVMGIEVSFNEDETGQVPSHWSVHGHGLGLDWASDEKIEGLRRALPSTALTRRPVHLKRLDGASDERAAAYPFKPQRVRRVTYLDRSVEGRRPFRNTHSRELRPDQHVTLAKIEHKFGLTRRLATHGIDPDEVQRAFDGT